VRRRRLRPTEPSGRIVAEGGIRPFATATRPPTRDEDPELWRVYDELYAIEAVEIIPELIRETFDQIYDGQRTGRWDYRQLNKTEKTHVGTLLQINVQKALLVDDGDELDYKIAGVDVDCKWSMTSYGWEIPREMYIRGPRIALVVWANDYTARWAAGLIRVEEHYLRPLGRQGDRKRRLNSDGCDRVLWLCDGGDIVQNTLLNLPRQQRQQILGNRSGQSCVNALFAELQRRLIDRATVLTAAMQDDAMKRARDARKALRPNGIVIFGHYQPHPRLAEDLGLPKPVLGTFVSARLYPDDLHGPAVIAGRRWRLATAEDPIVEAPGLPSQGRD
jgi:hypothetical protein